MKLQLKTASSISMSIRTRVEMLTKTRGFARLFWACDKHKIGAPYALYSTAPMCGKCKEQQA